MSPDWRLLTYLAERAALEAAHGALAEAEAFADVGQAHVWLDLTGSFGHEVDHIAGIPHVTPGPHPQSRRQPHRISD